MEILLRNSIQPGDLGQIVACMDFALQMKYLKIVLWTIKDQEKAIAIYK